MFQLHGVDVYGKAALRKRLNRSESAKFIANLEPCVIGMEACGGAHHWARKLHTVKLMPPLIVRPYVKTNKMTWRNAEVICEAVNRPNMRFVPMKNIEQQAILSVHRARQPNSESRPRMVKSGFLCITADAPRQYWSIWLKR